MIDQLHNVCGKLEVYRARVSYFHCYSYMPMSSAAATNLQTSVNNDVYIAFLHHLPLLLIPNHPIPERLSDVRRPPLVV